MTNKSKNAREIALDIVIDVLEEEKYSHLVIRETLNQLEDSQDDKVEKNFITRLAQGTIERKITLDYVINQFSKVKVQKMKPFIRNLLRISVYQILFMDSVPDSATCNEAVKLAKKRGFINLAPFVNGVLRGIARGKDGVTYPDESKEPVEALSVIYSVPEWLVSLFLSEKGEKATKEILENMLEEPAILSVRVNTSIASVEETITCLKEEGVMVSESGLAENMLMLERYGNIADLKAFQKGMIQVQDISSALVGQISGAKKGDCIIDMCAAPGGKTIHVADRLEGTGTVIANDISEHKTALILENVKRCGFRNVRISVQDATVLNEDYKNQADIVLADVPCSGLGVLKHKSEIKYRLQQEDIRNLAEISQKILNCAVQYLKCGGTLIFSTCTMTNAENEAIREWLLQTYDLEPVSITKDLSDNILDIGNNRNMAEQGYLSLNIRKEYDGFFMAKFKKNR